MRERFLALQGLLRSAVHRAGRHCAVLVGLFAMLLAGQAVRADSYPSKPIRIVIPFSPGGATDVVARLVANKLGEALKQSVVVESRPGANGIIGTDAVAKATPDGYTLLATVASAHTLIPSLYKLPYDPIKDFAPISQVATLNGLIVVNAGVPAKSMQEFIALAKSKPGQLSYSSGTSLINLIGEQFKQAAGIDLIAVPYKGTGPQLTAVVSGEVSMTIDPYTGLSFIKAGKIRPLAVIAPKRTPLLPDVPTLEETGIKGVSLDSWAGILAPAGVPKEIVRRLSAEIARIVALPDVRERMAAINYEPVGNSPEQFAEIIEREIAKWRRVVKETNFKVEQ
ncbi:MAG: hypothetical protein IOMNBAOH_00343 [Rhodocyclaceae bacterium]|nr:hypothetical protein [Rhodocyclaceae bacterium]